jgi:hypothetical protein
MATWDPARVALVVARSGRSDGGKVEEHVATGFFLTGDLVLTARHVAPGTDAEFEVRADIGGSEAGQWARAKPIWWGVGDVDAILLHSASSFGDWQLPDLHAGESSGKWESSGYAGIADDIDRNNRKTLPLDGTFAVSGGQGHQELSLTTLQQVAPDLISQWSGVSGAPVLHKDDGGLLGLITDARRALTNGLVGLPIARLLDDIHFRTALRPSFLGVLPEAPFCLVVTREGGSSELPPNVAGVLDGFIERDPTLAGMHPYPIELRTLDALASVENWAASVQALARAEVVVADVTGFQPGLMLLLGIRSVLRRGVTISVTAAPLASHTSSTPFNVQETKVLYYGGGSFYHDLHRAMAEGIANLQKDGNYLDLPSYHAVRAPRPDSWADEDSDSVLVLCPFHEPYSQLYEQKLEPIIRGSTQDKSPARMLDLRSPRLVGQSLYEQIRWATYCLVDWTGWRANVSFELGVRLASSEHDPLIVVQDPPDGQLAVDELEQHRLLRDLLGPHPYDPGTPHENMPKTVKAWSRPDRVPGSPVNNGALAPGVTFSVAQRHFDWRQEAMLERPDREQRRAAERMLGIDPERHPERLILYSADSDFDLELTAAVREKWIAAWLYLDHDTDGGQNCSEEARAEFLNLCALVQLALATSEDPRHKRLRHDISRLLRGRRDLDQVVAIKAIAKSARIDEDWNDAVFDLEEAVELIVDTLGTDAARGAEGRLHAELADVYGVLGGVERRWALASNGADRDDHLARSVAAYDSGFEYELRLEARDATTYNRINRLVGRVLREPRVLEEPGEDGVDVRAGLRDAEREVQESISSSRRRDPWAYCDLGTIQLLLGTAGADGASVVHKLERLRPQRFVYESWMATLALLVSVASDIRPELATALEQVQLAARYAS